MEHISADFADHVIISNDLWQGKLVCRSAPAEKCSVILNYPDPSIFNGLPLTNGQVLTNKWWYIREHLIITRVLTLLSLPFPGDARRFRVSSFIFMVKARSRSDY